MNKTSSMGKKDSGVAMNIVLGGLISIICMLLLSVLLTVLVENETVSISSVSVFTMAIHLLSVFLGTILSITLEKGRIAVIAGIITVAYLVVLLCVNMLVFSAGFNGFGAGILSALAGGVLAILLKGRLMGKKKYKIKKRSR
jgi:MFS family permease